MVPGPVRLFNPHGKDRVAVVSTTPAVGRVGGHLIQVARGLGRGKLSGGTSYGPFPEDELPTRFADVVAGLRAEGFGSPGLPARLTALGSAQPALRARAALRLGWRREVEAVGPLLAALPAGVDDVCSLIDALGAIGDPQALPALRAQATRKLLSRRRSAVEALRTFDDGDGLAEAAERACDLLPSSIRSALDVCDPAVASGPAVDALLAALEALPVSQAGLAADTLYELATPAAVAAALRFILSISFDQPYLWRYAKSIFKRSMLRHDHVAFGLLAHAIEEQGRRTPGAKAKVKSGYDGVERETPIFRRKTRDYLRRLSWRYLRTLARYQPSEYPHAAAEALSAYGPDDAEEPQKLRGSFARCYLLQRILYGSSTRFVFDSRRMTFHFRNAQAAQPPAAGLREEAFPALWDAEPRAYLRVLGAARLPEAHVFALQAIAGRHPATLATAPLDEVLPLLGAPHLPTVELGLSELQRRFDPTRPDWSVLDRLLADNRPLVQQSGRDWLRQTAPLWTTDSDRLVAFLTNSDVTTALLAAELASTHLDTHAAFRQSLSVRLVPLLFAPEARPGSLDAVAKLIRVALAAEAGALLSVHDLARLVATGPLPVQALAGDLLGRRPEALGVLGMERVAGLAQQEVAAVRAAAHALIRSALDALRADPSLLFVLAESDWEDTRSVALDLLREAIGAEALGFEGLMGLLDSNRVNVQDLGRSLVKQHMEKLPARVLAERLVQHPHPNMRRFALDLLVSHLPDGASALAPLSGFFRTVVLDLAPERLMKRRVVDFLLARGLRDEWQAEVAARLLAEFVRLQTRSDAEHALEALVRLGLAYPKAAADVGLGLEAVS